MDFISDFRRAKEQADKTSGGSGNPSSSQLSVPMHVETAGIDSLFRRSSNPSAQVQSEAPTSSILDPPQRSRTESSSSSLSSSSDDTLEEDNEESEPSCSPHPVPPAAVPVAARGVSNADLKEEKITAYVGICSDWMYSCFAVDGDLGIIAIPLRGGGLKVYTNELDVVLPGPSPPGEIQEVVALRGRGVVVASAANVVFVWDLVQAKDSPNATGPVTIEISQTSSVTKLCPIAQTGMCLVGTSTGNTKVIDATDGSAPFLASLVLDSGGGDAKASMVTVLATNKDGSVWMIGNEKSPVRFYSPASRGWLADQKAGINTAAHGSTCIAGCEFQPNAWITVWVSSENDLWMDMPNGTSIDLPREAENVFDIIFGRDGMIRLATCLGEFMFDAVTGVVKTVHCDEGEESPQTTDSEIVDAHFDGAREKMVALVEANNREMNLSGFTRAPSMSSWKPAGRHALCELPKGQGTEKLLGKLSKDGAAGIRTWDLGRWEGVLLCGGNRGLRCYVFSDRKIASLFTLTTDTAVTAVCADVAAAGTIFAGYSDGSVISLATKSQVFSCDEGIHALQVVGNFVIVTTVSGRRFQVDYRLLISSGAPTVDLAASDVVVGQFPGVTVRSFGLVETPRWTVLACEGSDVVAAQLVDMGGEDGRCVAVANEEGSVEVIRLRDGVLVGRSEAAGGEDSGPSLVWITSRGLVIRFYAEMRRAVISEFNKSEDSVDESTVVLAQKAYVSRMEVTEATLEVSQRMQEQIRQGAVIEASQRAANRAVAGAASTFGHIRDKLRGGGGEKQDMDVKAERRGSGNEGVRGKASAAAAAATGTSSSQETQEMLSRARAQIASNREKLSDIQEKSAQMSQQSEDMLRMARDMNKKQQRKKWLLF
ncbi:hypothetical protein FOL47_006040 [Perkinsus chesapeaki]|uniref:V-SNARE coiled-coil homology domain-containing protein n=1 Tax=Perkinsus chesapeaki TaxID=330153 RepID=A0A7J6LU82_PERCH|nr:hypothetical protein FOL47_006040 [Perkinsus chesapeaki]